MVTPRSTPDRPTILQASRRHFPLNVHGNEKYKDDDSSLMHRERSGQELSRAKKRYTHEQEGCANNE